MRGVETNRGGSIQIEIAGGRGHASLHRSRSQSLARTRRLDFGHQARRVSGRRSSFRIEAYGSPRRLAHVVPEGRDFMGGAVTSM